ncbi:MAG: ABC transporter ATP-binding protein [Armatimonadota bacterium]
MNNKQREDNILQHQLWLGIKPHIKYVVLGLICAGLAQVINIKILDQTRLVVDASTITRDIRVLNRVSLFVLFGFLLKFAFTFGNLYWLQLASNRFTRDLRDRVFVHLQELSLSYYSQRRTGGLISLLTNDINAIASGGTLLKDMVAAPLGAVGGLFMLFYYSWKLALIALLLVPVMAWVIRGIGRRIRRISAVSQGRLEEVTATMQECIAGIRVIKAFTAEPREISKFKEQNFGAYKATMKGVVATATLKPLIEQIGACGIAFVLWMGGRLIVDGQLTFGALASFLLMLNLVAQSMQQVGGLNSTRQQMLAAAERIFRDILNHPATDHDDLSMKPMPAIKGDIRFDHINFSYGEEQAVLQDVNFTIAPGKVVALVGPSGSGKSTMADLIPRFYTPTSGKVYIDGIDISQVSLSSLRKQIGIVPQETMLFAGTIRDNIAYGRPDATDDQVVEAAKAANADIFIERMPDKYLTTVGERGIRVSGGERQRIAIARAILNNPRVLILDEATSSLDTASEKLVQDALDKLMQARSTLVIAHRLSTVIHADMILVLDRGQIIERGTHAELIELGGTYAGLFKTQFS